MKIKKIIALALVLVVAVAASGCTTYDNFKHAFLEENTGETAPTIKIGVFECLTGQYKSFGKEEAAGIELAHKLYPKLLGKDVELIYADNHSNMYDAVPVMQELVSNGPQVVLGSYGEVITMAASDVLVANSIPGISISCSNPMLTANNSFCFTTTFGEPRQGEALAEYAVEALNRSNFAVIKAANDDIAVPITKRFTNRIKKLASSLKEEDEVYAEGVRIMSTHDIDPNGTDYSVVIKEMMDSGVQTVFMPTSAILAKTFMEQCFSIGYYPMFIGISDWNTDDMARFLKKNVDSNVAFTTVQATENTEMSKTFIEAFRKEYGDYATPTGAMANAFDSYLLAMRAIQDAFEKVSSTPLEKQMEAATTNAAKMAVKAEYEKAMKAGIPTGVQIRDALRNINDFEGASGILSYDGDNEVTKSVIIRRYYRGNLVADYIVE